MNKVTTFLFAILALVISISNLNAQCPPGDVTFETQNDLQEFKNTYPDCTELQGDVIIGIKLQWIGDSGEIKPINSLSPLRDITSIAGKLEIVGPQPTWEGHIYYLTSLSGLSNLKSAHEVHIDGAYLLENLRGLDSLRSVDILKVEDMSFINNTYIGSNDGLMVNEELIWSTNTTGNPLRNLLFSTDMKNIELDANVDSEDIGTLATIENTDRLSIIETEISTIPTDFNLSVNDILYIQNNQLLENIDGLYTNTEIEEITFRGNNNVENALASFKNLERVTDNLFLTGNFELSSFPNLHYVHSLNLQNEFVTDFSDFQSLDSIGNIIAWQLPLMTDLSSLSDKVFFGNSLTLGETGVIHLNDIQLNTDTLYNIRLVNNEALNDISFLSSTTQLRSLNLTSCNSLANLESLANLNRVESNLTLKELGGISNLNGLSKIEYIGSLNFSFLPIQDLSGLNNLTELGSRLSILDNNTLENFDALSNLTSIRNHPYNSLSIRNNAVLNSIDGLQNVWTVIGDNLNIQNNPNLSTCSLDFICQSIAHSESIWNININDNKEDCNDIEEVKDFCGFNFMEVFLDENGNGLQEIDEPNISIGEIQVGDLFLLYPNNQGRLSFLLGENPGFIEYIPEPFWEITTGNAYIPTPDLLTIPDLIKIGIKGTDNFVDIASHLNFEPVICSRNYSVSGIVKNEGTESVSASIQINAQGEFISSNPIATDTTDSNIYFELGEILPGETVYVSIYYVAPSVEDIDLDTQIEISHETIITDQNGNTTIDTGNYSTTFLCAYDPNDKQVFPQGVEEEQYTLFEEDEFEYLIRFQNTGNFPAQDVSITDTLDFSLDPTTFEFIDASHEVTRIKRDGQALEFVFKNIFLPDSLNNEPESHGFVHFKINRKEDLPENTLIENTAHIYFDFNPAIVTNTVFNTMVTMLPSAVDESILKQRAFDIFPNPTSEHLILRQKEQAEKLNWTILDIRGVIIQQGVSRQRDTEISLLDCAPGIYFVKANGQTQKLVVH